MGARNDQAVGRWRPFGLLCHLFPVRRAIERLHGTIAPPRVRLPVPLIHLAVAGRSGALLPSRTVALIEVLFVLLMRCRHQLVKRTLEATAARRGDGKKTSIEALADGFGHAARTMTDTIDWTDDGVATCDHFLDTV